MTSIKNVKCLVKFECSGWGDVVSCDMFCPRKSNANVCAWFDMTLECCNSEVAKNVSLNRYLSDKINTVEC